MTDRASWLLRGCLLFALAVLPAFAQEDLRWEGPVPATVRLGDVSRITLIVTPIVPILVGDDWSGVRFTREELAEETSRVVCAYLADRIPS